MGEMGAHPVADGSLHGQLSGCLALRHRVVGWLHMWVPQSWSRQGLGESWGEMGASMSQTLASEHAKVQPSAPQQRLGSQGGPTPWSPPPRGAVGGFPSHFCGVLCGEVALLCRMLNPGHGHTHPFTCGRRSSRNPVPQGPRAHPVLTCGHQPGPEAAEPQEQEQ